MSRGKIGFFEGLMVKIIGSMMALARRAGLLAIRESKVVAFLFGWIGSKPQANCVDLMLSAMPIGFVVINRLCVIEKIRNPIIQG